MKTVQPSPNAYYGYVQPQPNRTSRLVAMAQVVHAWAAWLMSTAVHVAVLLLLALIVISGDAGNGIQIISSEDAGDESELQLVSVDLTDSRVSAAEDSRSCSTI